MKISGLKLVAAFQIVYGCCGLSAILGVLLKITSPAIIPMLWYGLFPLLSLMVGFSLLWRWKYSRNFSFAILLLQVPFIKTGDFLLNLGAPLNFTFHGIWLSQHGEGPTILGINALALGALLLLLNCSPIQEQKHSDELANKIIDQPQEHMNGYE